MSAIQWYNNPKFDAPALNSPQPCIHGAGCVHTVKGEGGAVMPGCCSFVHPGEEGNGRRLFPESIVKGVHKPACVRLTGNAGFYERRRLRLSWQAWCELKNIPYTPNKAGVHHVPVKRVPIGHVAATMEPSVMVSIKDNIEALYKVIASSSLTEKDKDLCTEDAEMALESIMTIHRRLRRAAGVPMDTEEKYIEALDSLGENWHTVVASAGGTSLNAQIWTASAPVEPAPEAPVEVVELADPAPEAPVIV